jgi:hypothetical protein
VVVDPGGAGDATTIQGGVNLILAAPSTTGRDTVIVNPGHYAESLQLDLAAFEAAGERYPSILAPGGFDHARVAAIHFVVSPPPAAPSVELSFRGLSIGSHVVQPGAQEAATWNECRFESGYETGGNGQYIQSFEGCEFRGRVVFLGLVGAFPFSGVRNCHFVGATVVAGDDAGGDLGFWRCRFEGPADTAVVALPSQSNFTHFDECTFSHARHAIIQANDSNYSGQLIRSCQFEDVADAAVVYGSDPLFTPRSYYLGPGLFVFNSRFARCGSAIDWHSRFIPLVELRADTIEDARTAGLVATVSPGLIDSISVSGCGGDGVVLLPNSGDTFEEVAPAIWVRDSRFERNHGSGLVVRDTMNAIHFSAGTEVIGCEFADNLQAGLSCQSESLLVSGNVARSNARDGFTLAVVGASRGFAVTNNTAALNGGSGIQLDSRPVDSRSPLAANLSAFNGLAGFRLGQDGVAVPLHNNAWGNTNGAGLPAGPALFEADPGLCDPLNGDDHVQARSPCAPTGPFGLVGALGVGCDASRIAAVALGGGDDANFDRVAVLGSRVTDVTLLNPRSATLDGAPATIRPPRSRTIRDVNHDGFDDLVLSFAELRGGSSVQSSQTLAISTASGLLEQGLVTERREHRTDFEVGDYAGRRQTDAPQFRLRSVRYDPTSRQLIVAFSSPGPGPVSIELFDIAGRRMARGEVQTWGGGELEAELATNSKLSSGVYFTRLRSGNVLLTSRVTVER